MIRKAVILLLTVSLFLYAAAKFYTDALRYDPLDDIFVKKAAVREAGAVAAKYAPGWGKEIYEKNLFSQSRTYMEPKPVVAEPVYVEPPKRPELSLKGIVLDTFGDYVAFIEINQAKATPLRKGDKVEDIEVTSVAEKKVMLQWNNEQIALTIEKIKTLSSKPRAGK